MPSRRNFFAVAFTCTTLLGIHIAEAGGILSAEAAYRQAVAGQITLVDIRRPDEWAATGTPMPAKRLDMRREDFEVVLSRLTNGNRDAPIALICAKGVRSSRLSRRLRESGFTNIIDIPEGMEGSYAGVGYIARGLPLNKN